MTTTKKKRLGAEEAEERKYRFTTRSTGRVLSYYIGLIEEPDDYFEAFDEIRHAGESDIIKLHINSPGGCLATALQFIRVLRETNATVIASVEGECCSAATILFLEADRFEISPHSIFMFHNYSGCCAGKGGEMASQIMFEQKWSELFLSDVYKDFLTEKEITAILDNRDIWLSGTEVGHRLEARAKIEKPAAPSADEVAITPVE